MEREEGKSFETSRDDCEITRLQEMNKSEIIKKCVSLTLALDKAEKEIEVYKQLVIQTNEQHRPPKTKIPNFHEMDYNTNWSWINKIVFILKKMNRPLLSSEMIAFITPYEQLLQQSRHKAQAFSAHLTKAVKYGRIRTYKLPGARGYYYVLVSWLSQEDGQLIKEYENKILFK